MISSIVRFLWSRCTALGILLGLLLSLVISGWPRIDLVKVSEATLGGLISLIVAFAAIAFRDWWENRGHKEREEKVIQLAALRGAAIRIRNDAEDQNLSGAALFAWLRSMLKAEKVMIEKAREITKVDGRLLEWQDRAPGLPYSQIHDAGQRRALRNQSGAIIRAEMVLNKYRF